MKTYSDNIVVTSQLDNIDEKQQTEIDKLKFKTNVLGVGLILAICADILHIVLKIV